MILRRILMNAADPDTTGSGGGVAAVPPAVAPAQPVVSTPAPVTVDSMLSAMDDPKTRDTFFAEMRRSGRIKGPAKATGTEPPAPEPAPAARAPEADMVSRADLARERAFTRSLAVHGQHLTDSQLARMERAFEVEKPGATEAGVWVAGYIADLGIGKASAAATVTPATPPPNAPSPAPAPTAPAQAATNRGAPVAPVVDADAIDFAKLSVADRDAFIARHGRGEYNKRVMANLRNTRISTR